MNIRNLPFLGAALHVGVRGTRIARVDEAGVALRGQGLVDGAGEAVRRVRISRANVAGEPREGAALDAVGVAVRIGPGQVAEVGGVGEHVRLCEVAGIQRLVPPWEGPVEAAFVTQDLLEGPQKVAVPDEELGVAVHVGRVQLVHACEILVAAGGGWEVARRRLVHQALDGGDEGQPVRRREISPFEPHVGVGTACSCGR